MSQISQTNPSRPGASSAPPAAESSPLLHGKLASVRRKLAAVSAGTGLAGALCVVVVLLAAEMLLDCWANGTEGLPFAVRAAFLAVEGAALLYALVRHLLLPLLFGPDDDAVALMVEGAEPAFGHRLIASVQLTRPGAVAAGASWSMVRAMIAQTEAVARGVEFGRVVKTDKLLRYVGFAAFFVTAGLAGFIYANTDNLSTTLLKRAFLADVAVPRKTHVRVLSRALTLQGRKDARAAAALNEFRKHLGQGRPDPEDGNVTLAPGEKVVLGAKALGLVPSGGKIEVIYDADQKKEEYDLPALEADKAPGGETGVFAQVLENVPGSFHYHIRLGDDVAPSPSQPGYKATVLVAPAVKKVEVTQVFPPYTRLGERKKNLGSLELLKGSSLKLAVTVNHPARATVVVLGPETEKDKADKDRAERDARANLPGAATPAARRGSLLTKALGEPIELRPDPADPNLYLADNVPLPPGSGGFSIRLVDENGLENKPPIVHPFVLTNHAPPSIKVRLDPDKPERSVLKGGRVDMIYDVSDDYGLGQLSLKYKVDDSEVKTVTIPLPDNKWAGGKDSRHGSYTFKMGNVQYAATAEKPALEGSRIEYWMEVENRNNITGPGVNHSDHYLANVKSKAEIDAEAHGRVGQTGDLLKIEAGRQEELNQETGEVLTSPGTVETPKETPKDAPRRGERK